MCSKEIDAAVRSQIASAPDASILPLACHRSTDRALLGRLRRDIEHMRGEVLLNPHEVKAVRAGRMKIGQGALERAGAESVEEYLAMPEEHVRRVRRMQ